jgi:hypothetical protein
MGYTVRRQTKGLLKPHLQALINNPEAARKNPKLASYMFAGRAFFLGTGFMAAGTALLVSSVSWWTGANNLKEFADFATEWSERTFPSLRVQIDHQADAIANEEWRLALEESEKEIVLESEWVSGVRQQVRKTIHS